MMIKFHCEGCDITFSPRFKPFQYSMPQGEEVYPIIRYGWCAICSEVTAIEFVPSLKKLQFELDNYMTLKNEGDLQFTNSNGFDIDGKVLIDLMAWRELRTEPSKCLKCTHPILSFDHTLDYQTIHPTCGSKFITNYELVAGTMHSEIISRDINYK